MSTPFVAFGLFLIDLRPSTMDVVASHADSTQEFARRSSVVVSLMLIVVVVVTLFVVVMMVVVLSLFVVLMVVVAVFPVGGFSIRSFFDVALLLLLFTFPFQSRHEIVFNLSFDFGYSRLLEVFLEVSFHVVRNFKLLGRPGFRILVA